MLGGISLFEVNAQAIEHVLFEAAVRRNDNVLGACGFRFGRPGGDLGADGDESLAGPLRFDIDAELVVGIFKFGQRGCIGAHESVEHWEFRPTSAGSVE